MTALTQDELLVLLIEECAEVQKAATKCLRFGFTANHEDVGYGKNDEVLASEVGDLLGVVDALGLEQSIVEGHRGIKIRRAVEVRETYGRTLGP